MKVFAKFLGQNGTDHEIEEALKIFEVGKSYRVLAADIGYCSSCVKIEGINIRWGFNSVLFYFHDENGDPFSIYDKGMGIFSYRRNIETIQDIDTDTETGKLLLVAVGALMGTPGRTDKHPEDILEELNETAGNIFEGGSHEG